MDVELVVRRVFVYALTTVAITLLIGITVYMGGLYAFGYGPRGHVGSRSRCVWLLRWWLWRPS